MKILFAWELGDNYGHLMRCLAVALQLRALGHDVRFAVCNCKLAEDILAPHGFQFIQTPTARLAVPRKTPPINFSDILIYEGMGEQSALRGHLRSWLEIFGLVKPDVVVLDYAPLALLSGRLAKLKVISVDGCFFTPPDVDPFPCIRPWEKHGVEELRQCDQTLLTSVNLALKSFGGEAIESLQKLYLATPTLFTTFPELDHYGARDQAHYIGPLRVESAGKAVDWPSTKTPKIYGYLRPTVAGVRELLTVLKREPTTTVCSIPGLPARAMAEFTDSNVHLYNDLLHLETILPKADLAITYSGAGVLTSSLLAGVPLLLVPHNAEQYLAAKRVEALGAGVVMGRDRSSRDFKLALDRLLSTPSYREAAQKFARNHADYSVAAATTTAVSAVLAAAN